jgi:hypothetical protein
MIGDLIVFVMVVGALGVVGIGVGIILGRRLDRRLQRAEEESDGRDDPAGH